jgi:peptidoglycan/LPS O-acetylase OafA/YrhL
MNSNKRPNFENLSGYRGFLALVVLLEHTSLKLDWGDLYVFGFMGQYVGVYGFFVLSAFLLTFHLLSDFHEASSNWIIMLRTLQYAIKRFFRIYLVFLLMWSLIIYEPTKSWLKLYNDSFGSLSTAMKLGYIGATHLWTVSEPLKQNTVGL